jgi:gamma-glutamyltranspeptidase
MWEWGASKLRLFDQSVHEFLPQGRAPKAGEIFRQPNLARTWRNLGRHGRDYYYSGELARKIVAASDAGGGYLKLPDLASQRSKWMDPISTIYRGYRIVEMPPKVAAGKRPRHSILPSMLFRENNLRMTFGCMGANMQPQPSMSIRRYQRC